MTALTTAAVAAAGQRQNLKTPFVYIATHTCTQTHTDTNAHTQRHITHSHSGTHFRSVCRVEHKHSILEWNFARLSMPYKVCIFIFIFVYKCVIYLCLYIIIGLKPSRKSNQIVAYRIEKNAWLTRSAFGRAVRTASDERSTQSEIYETSDNIAKRLDDRPDRLVFPIYRKYLIPNKPNQTKTNRASSKQQAKRWARH